MKQIFTVAKTLKATKNAGKFHCLYVPR